VGRLGAIVAWSLVNCTVSLVVRTVGEHFGSVGRVIESVLGLAWSLTTYLVLPLLAVERESVPGAFRRSQDLFRRTWGTNITASLGIGVLAMIAVLVPVAVLLAAGLVLGDTFFRSCSRARRCVRWR